VINKEWKLLDEKKLSPSAEQILVEVSRGLANWRPSEPLEAMIKTHALKKLNWISDLRYQRLFDTYGGDIPSIFWIVAVAGFILTLIPYLIYELSKLRFVLLSCYAAMIGIAFYSIALLNNPFIGHLVSPKAFEVVYMEMNKEVESETSHGLSSSKTVPAKSPKASD
jgi:hypothetical protein